jgi:hypothetical protein
MAWRHRSLHGSFRDRAHTRPLRQAKRRLHRKESTASWDACAPREASSLPTLARYAEPRRDHNCPSMVIPEQAQRHGGQASTHGPDSREQRARHEKQRPAWGGAPGFCKLDANTSARRSVLRNVRRHVAASSKRAPEGLVCILFASRVHPRLLVLHGVLRKCMSVGIFMAWVARRRRSGGCTSILVRDSSRDSLRSVLDGCERRR